MLTIYSYLDRKNSRMSSRNWNKLNSMNDWWVQTTSLFTPLLDQVGSMLKPIGLKSSMMMMRSYVRCRPNWPCRTLHTYTLSAPSVTNLWIFSVFGFLSFVKHSKEEMEAKGRKTFISHRHTQDIIMIHGFQSNGILLTPLFFSSWAAANALGIGIPQQSPQPAS